MTAIRAATAADRAQVAASLASAFSEDPLFAWMSGAGPSPSIEPKMRILFDAFLKLGLPRRDHLVCTDEDAPAYLESSNPRNTPFYARHGSSRPARSSSARVPRR